VRPEESRRAGGDDEPAAGQTGDSRGGDGPGADSRESAGREGARGSSAGGSGGAGGLQPAFWSRLSLLGVIRGRNSPKDRPEGESAPRRGQSGGISRPNAAESAVPPAFSGPEAAHDARHNRRRSPTTPVTTLDGVLTALRRRALGDAALHWALLGALGWAAAVSLLLVWSKVTPTSHVTAIAAGLALPAALLAGAAWVFQRPTTTRVARVADARLELSERLASALFYADTSGDMEARLRADAIGAASRYRPAQAFPLRRHRALLGIALTVAVVAVLLALTPNPQAATLAREAADGAATAQARKVVASARQRLGRPSTAEGQEIAHTLQAAASQLAKAGTPLASLVALSDLSRQLAQLDNYSGEENQAADAAAGDAMAAAPGAQRLASDLANGNLQAAAAGLRSLANRLSNLSPAQRQALAAALGKAAASAGYKPGTSHATTAGAGSDQRFTGGLAQASSALSAGHLSAAGQALKSAAAGAAASASALSLQQQLAADQAAVQNEEAKVASQAQSAVSGHGKLGPTRGGGNQQLNQGSGPGHNGPPSGGLPGGAGARAPGSAGSNGAGSSGTGSSGSGSGAGGGSGSQGSGGGSGSGSGGAGSGGSAPGPGGKGQGGEGGPGEAKSPKATGGARSGPANPPSDQVFIAGQPGSSAQVIGAQVGAGGAVKTTPYQKVLASFEKTALQSLGSHVVSPADQGAVRSYFSSLGSGG
jgi:hypothetical protein